MELFQPKQVFFEPKALTYPMGDRLYHMFKEEGVPLKEVESHQKVPPLDFNEAKETLVLGTKKDLRLQSCRPSAHYRLVFSSSCPGRCHYCYLATGLGPKIYLRIYVNLQEIMEKARVSIEKRMPDITSFEASSSSDPLAVEHLTKALRELIPFFNENTYGRLKIATKFTHIEPLLPLNHGGNTRIRFSINTPYVIESFEEGTPPAKDRIERALKVAEAGYPTGFLLAPLLLYPGWREEYERLVQEIAAYWREAALSPPSFEVIMLRLTKRACRLIEKRYPHSLLDMDLERREHKGFGKYVYPSREAQKIRDFLEEKIREYFQGSSLEYFT